MADLSEKKHEATLRDFLNVVFRWKLLILSVFLFTTFFVVYLKTSKPLTYVSSSRILVKRGERADVFTPTLRYRAWAEEMSSQLQIVLSEAVFSRARDIFADSLASRGLGGARGFHTGAVRADVVGESNVIVVSYSGLDPVECELGCKAVTTAYVEYFRENTAPPAVTDFFEAKLGEVFAELSMWREKKSEFLNREDYIGMQEDSRHLMGKLSRLEMNLADVNTDLSSQKVRLERIEGLLDFPDEELARRMSTTRTEGVVQSKILGDIRLAIQRLMMDREELLTKYTERHPEVIAVDNQLADLQEQLKQELQNAYEREIGVYNELAAERASLQVEIGQVESAISELPAKEKELSRIESNITASEENYKLLLSKQHEAEIAIASSPEFEVTVLSPPGRAFARRTSDYVRLAVGPFLSLIVGLGLAFFFESMDRSVKNTAEVEQYLGSNVLVTIPEVSDKDRNVRGVLPTE